MNLQKLSWLYHFIQIFCLNLIILLNCIKRKPSVVFIIIYFWKISFYFVPSNEKRYQSRTFQFKLQSQFFVSVKDILIFLSFFFQKKINLFNIFQLFNRVYSFQMMKLRQLCFNCFHQPQWLWWNTNPLTLKILRQLVMKILDLNGIFKHTFFIFCQTISKKILIFNVLNVIKPFWKQLSLAQNKLPTFFPFAFKGHVYS